MTVRFRRAALVMLGLGVILAAMQRLPSTAARGVSGGQLAPCPGSPNCVGSNNREPARSHMPPWVPVGSGPECLDKIRRRIGALPGFRVAEASPGYLHVVATTPLLRFKDDLEFAWDEAAGVVQVRSASRVGYSDLGTNRRRLTRLHALFRAEGIVSD